ncbi:MULTISPECIES: hypothetical protein [Brochothrix]|uniref:Uncharacterized protein n=1 Tax=Brochothrix thermosphacta TaxID=2756 RepID=A0A1D2L734_BROTH|nr:MULTISPECIES: hypothetical protein [Brochothrix]SLN01980.1 hypothetical protein FM106_22050 [Brachybacterium faecium]ANZ95879.1 hypothetical protein BFC19_11035 [Brochothrix thermosphacta]ANZ97987.1 hypothetical protein BFC20_09890 [Brochothrix thermosphacta]ATF25206.1 hypothetical protein CNY62_01730 [Brochothrix thermosphacta]ATH84589.1 hypothetical protein CPF12_01560 [Brochothrix thermosphacta]
MTKLKGFLAVTYLLLFSLFLIDVVHDGFGLNYPVGWLILFLIITIVVCVGELRMRHFEWGVISFSASLLVIVSFYL